MDNYGSPEAPPVKSDVKCRDVPREECRLVEKEVCVPVARPVEKVVTRDQCRDEPVTQCRIVTKARPQKKCVPVDVEKCRWVVRVFKQEAHQQVTLSYKVFYHSILWNFSPILLRITQPLETPAGAVLAF